MRPLAGHAQAAVFDPATGIVGGAQPGCRGAGPRSPWCPRPARAATGAAAGPGDGDDRRQRRPGVRVDARRLLPGRPPRRHAPTGSTSRVKPGTDFTAIARRADGKLVLGSADGAVYTLSSDTAVGASLKIFARVDALVTQGNTAVVLDRGQTSVTTVRRQRQRRRACAARRRGGDHDGGRSGGPGAGRRHPRRRAAGVRRRPADPASALPGAGRAVRPGRLVDGWPGCRRRRRTRSLVTIWPPAYPSRRCVIEPCSSRTPWPSTKRLAPCMWCRARERVCR